MSEPSKTVLYDKHAALGAKIVEFGGYLMPIQYPTGIVEEHLLTRKKAGIFDVSHMGRFIVRGKDKLAFLQHALTNNAAALGVGQAQYTMIPNERGGAVDDAYLYRFFEGEYLLVVNAANRRKDWNHLQGLKAGFDVEMADRSEDMAMISLQGPLGRDILGGLIQQGHLPQPMRNELSWVIIDGVKVLVGRTGYTGEPLCFELFVPAGNAAKLWDELMARGARPIGLGARDTLRLEAGLPLYGHELGTDVEGKEIPIFACPLAKFAVSFSAQKGQFVGRDALARQYEAFRRIMFRDYTRKYDLPRMVMPLAILGKGVARAGAKVFADGRHVGYVTSGTVVPYWKTAGDGLASRLTDERAMRGVALALIDSDVRDGRRVQIEVRGSMIDALVVPYNLRSEAPPYARTIVYTSEQEQPKLVSAPTAGKVHDLLNRAAENTTWRQRKCINLIPSEMTVSPMARMLSIMDPAFRYAEHKEVRAFDFEVFYYQGTRFIEQVERELEREFREYLGCAEIESRVISGQLANAAVFSAMLDYINRADRRTEPRRIRYVLNNHIMRGGHLSAQPMGALKDFVARDPVTEKPAVVNFPVLADNPYKVDVKATREVLACYRPELIIFGKSMVLHTEPVAEIRRFVDDLKLNTVIMYDMAHVLGLVGPHFQEPFKEGADIVTGSTHKTFFGTQRGVVAGNFRAEDEGYHLWDAIRRRTFPGSVSNHHLGTLLGLLMAAYEMNYFKDEYQRKVIANAKALAMALKRTGLDVAGDPAAQYTQTHQVIVNVGYGKGPEVAQRLEDNNIIVNYQAAPAEEGFTASGSLRLGVSEMTRFGMEPTDFETLAQLIHDVVAGGQPARDKVEILAKFLDLKFCFSGTEFEQAMARLHKLV